MKWLSPAWYLLLVPLAFVPAAWRMAHWQRPRPQPIDVESAQAGQKLFTHEWTLYDPLCPDGDGLGPVFNATSCVACHHQGGVGGAGGLKHNVTTFTVRPETTLGKPREGVVHAAALLPKFREDLSQVDRHLPPLTQ